MNADFRLPDRLALGAVLVATGAAIGSLATWSLVQARACTSCAQVHVSAPVRAANPASCTEDSTGDEVELVQLARVAPRVDAMPARAPAGVHLTRWAPPRRP